jgi:hypothetical protein
MYQLYIYGFTDDGEINGGDAERLGFKIAVFSLLFLSFYRIINVSAALHNFVLKMPLFYYLANLIIIAPFLEGAHRQALNIFFFVPFFFVDWRSFAGINTYKYILKFISLIVLFQACTDPIIKNLTGIWWENKALIGGLGNPSVMGLFLITACLYFQFFLNKFGGLLSLLCFLLLFFTGAAMPIIIGCFLQFIFLIKFWRKYGLFFVIISSLIIVFSVIFSSQIFDQDTDLRSILHFFGKILALFSIFSQDLGGESLSVSGRIDYFSTGISLLSESPLAILWGHPNYLPMYNGDGLYIAFLVTFGFPFLMYFFAVNLYLIIKHINSNDNLETFSAYMIFVYMIFFVTNRILDYWPSAFVYVIAFSFLSGRYSGDFRRSKSECI